MKKRTVKTILTTMLIGCAIMGSSCQSNPDNANQNTGDITYVQLESPKEGDPIATIKTSMGDITVRLFPEYAPKAVENFTTHAKDGYYDGTAFHRVIKDFMLQGGDPLGNGTGGESIWGAPFEDEIVMELHNIRGALSMANAGPNTNGSQFFIVQNTDIGPDFTSEFEKAIADPNYTVNYNSLSPYKLADRFPVPFMQYYVDNGGTPHLDYPGLGYQSRHTVFGQVIEGMDIVDAIAAVETDPNDKPLEPVTVQSVTVSEYTK